MKYRRGTTTYPPLTGYYRNANGDLIDPVSPELDVFDPDNVQVVVDAVPTRQNVGTFTYPYDIAEDAKLGFWRAVWKGFIDGIFSIGEDEFEVVEAANISGGASQITRLRRMVGDRIPLVGSPGTFFDDDEIADLIVQANGDLNLAALNGWLAKMAEFAPLVDRDVSGANLRLSQMYKNAESMARFYASTVSTEAAAYVGRVVGRVVSLREKNCRPRIMPVSGGFRLEAVNPEARALMQRSKPETLDDPLYPEPGPIAT